MSELENPNVEFSETSAESAAQSPADLASLLPSRDELLGDEFDISEKPTEKAPKTTPKATKAEKEANITPKEESASETSDVDSIKKEAIEEFASKHGWRPKEEWRGEQNNWTSAEEYLNRSSMTEKLSHRGKELKAMRRAQEDLTNLVKKQAEMINNEKMQRTLEQKRDAIEQGDVQGVEKYEQQHAELKKEHEEISNVGKKEAVNGLEPEVSDFVDRNKDWFNQSTPENSSMAAYATGLDTKLTSEHPEWSLGYRLSQVETMTKSYYGGKSEPTRQNRPAAVESKTARVTKDPRKIGYNDLPPEGKQIVRRFIKTGLVGNLTADEYAQQLVETGAIEL